MRGHRMFKKEPSKTTLGYHILPERKRLPKFSRGDNYVFIKKVSYQGVYPTKVSDECIPCIADATDQIKSHWVNPKEVKTKVKVFTSPYLVVMRCRNARFQKKRGKAFLIENKDKLCATVTIGIWEFEQREEAQKLLNWLNSEEFTRLFEENDFVSANARTFRNMPSYE